MQPRQSAALGRARRAAGGATPAQRQLMSRKLSPVLSAAAACFCWASLPAGVVAGPDLYNCAPMPGGGISDPAGLYGSKVQVNVMVDLTGSVLMAGRFSAVNGTRVTGFAKLAQDGTVTSAGNLTGYGGNPPEIRSMNGGVYSVAIGGVFTAGTAPTGGAPVTMNNIGFYFTSGSQAGTFTAYDSGCNGPINAVVQLQGGPWVVGGSFTSCGSGFGPNVAYLQVSCLSRSCCHCHWQPELGSE